MSMRRQWGLVLVVALAGSQVGHLFAYQAQSGHRALGAAHSYLPALGALAGGLAGLAVLSGLLLVAAARLLGASRRGLESHAAATWLDLFAVVFTVQLAVFFSQETAESLLGGLTAMPGPDLLLWGALGQLPVAAVAALALRWLTVRLEAALQELGAGPRRAALPAAWPQVRTAIAWTYPGQPLLASAPAAFLKRGPPRHLRLSH